MSVYVDELFRWRDAGRFFAGLEHCHLTADKPEELHELATRIGLRPEWVRLRAGVPCFDISETKRNAAKRAGAVFMSELEQRARKVGWS